ncbi:diaminopimelate decarboxylase [Ktedonosporobacter rubrisoli]|uniref:Diaminopimelate decarboxylase n=1 Tax=Ktedonosporobacter rubrisoli TaxID=2509675 RepID=A0A4P6JM10_KTERU|nr:diaminopimelate decarboxylase [Ktedonosporobacter rubrisoli]QBD75706.1 diaminopimelate decarboxylase [Ktedonosporobacter rubrisoli]
MVEKAIPFTQRQLEKILKEYPTPFHIYDERGIRQAARELKQAFAWMDGFTNYFAVKALPNPYILQILKAEGFGADCSSLPELLLAERVGITGSDIMFSSNETPIEEYGKAKELGAIINLDDTSHIAYLEKYVGLPDLISFRYNPGPRRAGNAIIGDPKEAKYGLTYDQLFQAYHLAKNKGVKSFGLHAMIASNELNAQYFIETANMLFDLVVEISQRVGITFSFVNLGGGIGIPYRPEQTAFDLQRFSQGVEELYQRKIIKNGLYPLNIVMECGRLITGPHGYLVTTAIHKKETYKDYVGLDACMTNLMRPALYGAYHHITVLGKEQKALSHKYDVVGSLCENFDKFAIDRDLPEVETGDTLIIHDTGAHGHAMGFNYNGKLRSAELLLKENGEVQLIRRAETIEDHFSTLDFSGLAH